MKLKLMIAAILILVAFPFISGSALAIPILESHWVFKISEPLSLLGLGSGLIGLTWIVRRNREVREKNNSSK